MQPAALRVTVADGVRLHVRHWPGDRDRVPFLLVPELGANARTWDGVAARLSAAGHPAYAVDLRGHGESGRPAGGYDTAGAAHDVAGVAAALNLPPAVVAGHGWGGNVTVALAAKQPDPVRAAALVGGGWIDLRAAFGSWPACENRLRPPALDGVPLVVIERYLRATRPEWAVEAALASFQVDGRGVVSRRLPVAAHLAVLRSLWDEPPAPLYDSVRAPALLVGAAGAKRAAAGLPHPTVKEYPSGDPLAVHHRRLAADLLMLAATSATNTSSTTSASSTTSTSGASSPPPA